MTRIGTRLPQVAVAAGISIVVLSWSVSLAAARAADDSGDRPPFEIEFVDTSENVGTGSVVVDTVDGPMAFPLPADAVRIERVLAPHHDYPAVDIPVPVGTPVFAPVDGIVVTTTATAVTWYEPEGGTCDHTLGPCDRCGIGVRLRDVRGWEWSLCHLELTGLTQGDHVAAGALVGLSGSTGHSSGPHLHVGLRHPDGVAVCPQTLLAALHSASLPAPIADLPVAGCTTEKISEPISTSARL